MLKIGTYNFFSIETGEFALDGGAMFGVIPKPLWERKIGVDARNRIDMRLRALLVQSNGRNILVDTGIGDKGDAKFNDIYRVDHRRFTLEKSLRARGLAPEDITDVVITHLHFDHAGGATVLGAGGKFVPTFPNATHYIQKRQYEWAFAASERDRTSFRKEDIYPLVDAGKVRFLDGESELFPGVQIKVSRGHTESEQHLFVTDGKSTLFYCADMIPTSVHVGVPWIMGYDLRPLDTLREKKEVLKRAVEEGWILFFEHCPHMAAAKIKYESGKFSVAKEIDV